MNESRIITFNRKLNITFEKCGLDIKRNFLQALICECGCGGKMRIILETQYDIGQFCGQMCDENDCCRCAVFAITKENKMIAAVKFGEDIQIFSCPLSNYREIGEFANEFNFHCYGLICWYEDNLYDVIER